MLDVGDDARQDEGVHQSSPAQRRVIAMRILLGPILLIVDGAPENQASGVGLCLLLLPCLAAVIVRPRWWSALLSLLAAVAWVFIGLVGDGIDC
jgi:hypothetical protein